MKRRVLTALALTFLAYTTIQAQETPRWLRQSALSPDGKTVAFCYQGDIFTVSAKGGEARQITSSSSYEADPVWSAYFTKDGLKKDKLGSCFLALFYLR